MPVGGKNPSGEAQILSTDGNGNLGTKLHVRNELALYTTNTVPTKGTRTIVNRFEGLENYAAIKVSVVAANESTLRVIANWYERTADHSPGLQVASVILQNELPTTRFQSDYLEIGGNQLSITLANTSDADVSVTVFIRGIR